MKHLFKSNTFKNILSILVIFLLVKLIWSTVAVIWLSPNGVYHKEKVGGKSLYYRVKLTPNEATAPIKPSKPVEIAGSIKDIILMGVYSSSDTTVVTIKYKNQTKILGRGDVVNGFVLTGGGSTYAMFTKNNKNYKVDLIVKKSKSASNSSITTSQVKPRQSEKLSEVKSEITDAGDHKIIDKSLLSHYAKNMDDIYKNIGITETKVDGKIKFSVSFVRRGSPFAQLGVKRGDIIKTINGQTIDSYNAAFEAYKNIDSAQNITLVIERGNEEMELEYEIN